MPQIFIENFSIENFGPFYGKVEFNFCPLEDRCGILIGGKNGAGKTHLLRAIYLAVVGETGVYDLSDIERNGSESTKFRFEQSLNRKASSEGTNSVSLEIDLVQRNEDGGGSKKLKLIRNHYCPNVEKRKCSKVL